MCDTCNIASRELADPIATVIDHSSHSFGLIAIRALATADTPQMKPTGNSRVPDCLVLSSGRKTATCAADAAANPVINVLFDGSEKLF